MLICVKCGKSRDKGRRRCVDCHKEQARERQIKRYNANGRYKSKFICSACKKESLGSRKSQVLCSECNQLKKQLCFSKANNNYLYDKRGKPQHRVTIEAILGYKLHSNQVIHHLDENPKNNQLNNLIVLSRSSHAKLHKYLEIQRVILEKSKNEKDVNCWDILRVPMTTAWLETAGVKVIKIWEIGQSAAKPLINGEGSETRHVSS